MRESREPRQGSSFLDRMQAVYSKPKSTDKLPTRRLEDFDFWPRRSMKIARLPTSETFIRLAETVNRFQHADSKTSAKNLLTYGVQLAGDLIAQLPGNDEDVKFTYEQLEVLERNSPNLAEDVSKIMQKVYDEKRFKEKR